MFQIALTDVLRNLGIAADGYIGHSAGEIACGYADGCMSVEETIKLAYYRGKIIEEANFEPGAMAAIGMLNLLFLNKKIQFIQLPNFDVRVNWRKKFLDSFTEFSA